MKLGFLFSLSAAAIVNSTAPATNLLNNLTNAITASVPTELKGETNLLTTMHMNTAIDQDPTAPTIEANA
jgi:hypothetical protein